LLGKELAKFAGRKCRRELIRNFVETPSKLLPFGCPKIRLHARSRNLCAKAAVVVVRHHLRVAKAKSNRAIDRPMRTKIQLARAKLLDRIPQKCAVT
jgi:hypothetical protein